MASQEVFKNVYQGRQGALHHMAYMRMAKVLLTQVVLDRAGVELEGKSLFDYGFGAGTFFRYCPASTRIAGVEIGPVNVTAVRQGLRARGRENVRLETIEIEHWEQHPLLQETYDVFLCSHVLEHLPEPAAFLRRIRDCLTPSGVFVGLVPINERRANPHHIQQCDQSTIQGWLEQSGLTGRCYLETDPYGYWVQPLFTADTGLRHRMAQVASLGLGVPFTLAGHRLWGALAPWYARLTAARPSQAAFVAGRREA